MSSTYEGFEATIRSVIKSGDSISRLVTRLTNLYGQGAEVDLFRERLSFQPREEVGNMNFVNRDCVVDIEYLEQNATMRHLVSTVTVGKASLPLNCEIFSIKTTPCSNCNFRKMFLKAGFVVQSDFGQKGLRFTTPHGHVITITRPHNAEIKQNTSYQSGRLTWENISGSPPLGQDYLLEVRCQVAGVTSIEEVLSNLQETSSQLVE